MIPTPASRAAGSTLLERLEAEGVEDDLHRRDAGPRDRRERLVAGLDRDAVGGDAPLLDERVEVGEERVVLDHGGRRGVELHEVEPLDAEVLARAVGPLAEARRRVLGVLQRHAAPHLGRDERALAGVLGEHAADQPLAAAVAVDVGRVDERDAGRERGLERRDRVASPGHRPSRRRAARRRSRRTRRPARAAGSAVAPRSQPTGRAGDDARW